MVAHSTKVGNSKTTPLGLELGRVAFEYGEYTEDISPGLWQQAIVILTSGDKESEDGNTLSAV